MRSSSWEAYPSYVRKNEYVKKLGDNKIVFYTFRNSLLVTCIIATRKEWGARSDRRKGGEANEEKERSLVVVLKQ